MSTSDVENLCSLPTARERIEDLFARGASCYVFGSSDARQIECLARDSRTTQWHTSSSSARFEQSSDLHPARPDFQVPGLASCFQMTKRLKFYGSTLCTCHHSHFASVFFFFQRSSWRDTMARCSDREQWSWHASGLEQLVARACPWRRCCT